MKNPGGKCNGIFNFPGGWHISGRIIDENAKTFLLLLLFTNIWELKLKLAQIYIFPPNYYINWLWMVKKCSEVCHNPGSATIF